MSDSPLQYIVLPARFEDVDLDDLVILIADMLQRLIAHNDNIPLSPESLTRFHSRSPPTITVLEYLRRIVKYTNVERTCLLITLHYIDQICGRLRRFTVSSLTVHRFIVSSVAVSSKALCDVFCTNTHYAKVGGIRVAELNLLEKEFLAAIDWRLTCTRELLQEYYVNLARTHSSSRYRIAEEGASGASVGSSSSPSPQSAMEDEPDGHGAAARVLRGRAVSPGPAAAAAAMAAAMAAATATLEQNMAFAALQMQEAAGPAPVPDRGEKRACGLDVGGSPRAVKRRLG